MQVLGKWMGVLFIDTLKEYIEGEVFRIEIHSIDAENAITATVTEQVQAEEFSLDQRDGFTAYQAEGTLDPQNGKLLLSYKANSHHGERIPIELTGVVDEQNGTIAGQYRLLTQPHSHASFRLKKTEEEPL